MRGAYQSPLSWTSKAIVLPVWTFPFRVVCMCVHVPTCTNVDVSCQNWLGWEKEKWVLKKWTNLFKLQYPWGSQCTDARESRPRMLLREHVVSGDMWLHPASLGRKEQQEETFPEPFREMKRSQETEWARLPGTEIGYAQPLFLSFSIAAVLSTEFAGLKHPSVQSLQNVWVSALYKGWLRMIL